MTALVLAAVFALFMPGPAVAEPLVVGDTLAPLTLEDQHGATRSIDGGTALVLFTRDMDAGEIVRDVLADDGIARLQTANAVYVADISGMPSLVFKLFAGPKLRKRPYPMVLDRDGGPTAAFPATEGRVTVMKLQGLKVIELGYVDTVAELRAVLDAPQTAEPLSSS